VSITAGSYRLGPSDGTLSVRTGRAGAVAKAGHDLRLEVTAWEATLEVGADTRIELTADATSLRVREGTGGVKPLDEGDKGKIVRAIDEDVLRGAPIVFRSTRADPAPGGWRLEGELMLRGETRPMAFDVVIADGTLSAAAVVRQTDFGIKPYSALFGAIKVADEVKVELEARLSI
jgi:polyisoprenoid-binding protein YceI